MSYYDLGGSDKHIRDILGVLKVQQGKVDQKYIEDWAGQLKLTNVWETVKAAFDKDS